MKRTNEEGARVFFGLSGEDDSAPDVPRDFGRADRDEADVGARQREHFPFPRSSFPNRPPPSAKSADVFTHRALACARNSPTALKSLSGKDLRRDPLLGTTFPSEYVRTRVES